MEFSDEEQSPHSEEEEEEEEDQFADETPDEKRVRLAQHYLEKLRTEASTYEDEDGEGASLHDRIANRLKHDMVSPPLLSFPPLSC